MKTALKLPTKPTQRDLTLSKPQSSLEIDLLSRLYINKQIYTNFFYLKSTYKPYNYILIGFQILIIYFITKIFINASFTLNTSLLNSIKHVLQKR